MISSLHSWYHVFRMVVRGKPLQKRMTHHHRQRAPCHDRSLPERLSSRVPSLRSAVSLSLSNDWVLPSFPFPRAPSFRLMAISAIVIAVVWSNDTAADRIGYFVDIFNVCLYASPLALAWKVRISQGLGVQGRRAFACCLSCCLRKSFVCEPSSLFRVVLGSRWSRLAVILVFDCACLWRLTRDRHLRSICRGYGSALEVPRDHRSAPYLPPALLGLSI